MGTKISDSIFRIKFSFLWIILLLSVSCEDNIVDPPDNQQFSGILKGKVILENQTEHSNALVYIDSLNRGVSTDSNGSYAILFTEEDSVYNGEFKLIYFLNDYDMDSAKIMLVDGKLKLDTLDVDSEGRIETKEMKQIVLVEGWTDKQEYRIGDTLSFTARFTNVTNRVIHLHIPSIFNQLGHVFLYNDQYPSFIISSIDPVTLDLDIDIYSPSYYEGKVSYIIPEGNYGATGFRPLPPDEYIVTTSLYVEDYLKNYFEDKFDKYVLEEWYKIHRGNSPKYDLKPNKYKFPHIKIIK